MPVIRRSTRIFSAILVGLALLAFVVGLVQNTASFDWYDRVWGLVLWTGCVGLTYWMCAMFGIIDRCEKLYTEAKWPLWSVLIVMVLIFLGIYLTILLLMPLFVGILLSVL